jgi:hypothetical protein
VARHDSVRTITIVTLHAFTNRLFSAVSPPSMFLDIGPPLPLLSLYVPRHWTSSAFALCRHICTAMCLVDSFYQCTRSVACTGSLWHGAECSWCLSRGTPCLCDVRVAPPLSCTMVYDHGDAGEGVRARGWMDTLQVLCHCPCKKTQWALD